MPFLARLLGFAVLTSSMHACCDDHRLEVDLASAGVTRAEVAAVELYVVAECPLAADLTQVPMETIATSVWRPATAAARLGSVPSGNYGLWAIARSSSCGVVAAGCEAIEVRECSGSSLRVALTRETGDACPPGSTCEDGSCVSPDAGVDAGVDGGDGALDGVADAGMSAPRVVEGVLRPNENFGVRSIAIGVSASEVLLAYEPGFVLDGQNSLVVDRLSLDLSSSVDPLIVAAPTFASEFHSRALEVSGSEIAVTGLTPIGVAAASAATGPFVATYTSSVGSFRLDHAMGSEGYRVPGWSAGGSNPGAQTETSGFAIHRAPGGGWLFAAGAIAVTAELFSYDLTGTELGRDSRVFDTEPRILFGRLRGDGSIEPGTLDASNGIELPGFPQPSSIVTDASGTAFVSGSGMTGAFVFASADGTTRWSRFFPSAERLAFSSVAVTGDHVFVGGELFGTQTFDGVGLGDDGVHSYILLRLDRSTGDVTWTRSFRLQSSSAAVGWPMSMIIDKSDNVVLALNYGDVISPTFDGVALEQLMPNQARMMIASYTPDGSLRFARGLGAGATGLSIGGYDSLALAPVGEGVYVAGVFRGELTFDDVAFPLQNAFKPFVLLVE